MKKYLIIVSFLVVLISPSFVSAATVQDLQAQINILMAQIQALQAQISQQQPEQWCYDFKYNLNSNSREKEVSQLQTALGKEGFAVDSEEKNGQIFGESTADAVIGFQQKYKDEILAPYKLKYGTGFVGKATRAKLNKLYSCGAIQSIPAPISVPAPTTTTTVTPSITVLSPNGGEVWAIGSNHEIKWLPDDSKLKVDAYLEKLVNGNFINIGKIYEVARGSIIWAGEINNYGNYAPAGEYYVRIINSSGVWDRSDRSFQLASRGTVSADLKVNGLDGPFDKDGPWGSQIVNINPLILKGGESATLSWSSSGANTCKLDASDYGPISVGSTLYYENFGTVPVSGNKIVTIPTKSLQIRYRLECSSSIGNTSDTVIVTISSSTSTTPSITVLSPNGGEVWEVGKTYGISWKTTNLSNNNLKVIVDLFKATDLTTGLPRQDTVPLNAVSATQGYMSWTIPQTLSSGNYRVGLSLIDYSVNSEGLVVNRDSSDAPFSIVAAGAGDIDLEVRSISKGDFYQYGFYADVCVSGSKSINELKWAGVKITNLPASYILYDSQGKKYQGDASVSGSIENLKNGQCMKYGWNIQSPEFAAYDQTKKIDYILDPNNLITEINEGNNYASYSEPISTSSITVISPNGVEVLAIGSTQTIKWTPIIGYNYVIVDLVRGTNNAYVKSISVGNSMQTGQLTWQIPSDIPIGSDYKIYINASNAVGTYTTVSDFSDTPFNIVAATASVSQITQMANILESAKSILLQISESLKNLR